MAGKDINRRKFISTSTAGALATSVISSTGQLHAAGGKMRPNILLIIADDMGDGDLGCYGHPTLRTPNIDRLAAGGLRFTNSFVTASSCSPCRASLFTGLYPHATGAEDLHIPVPAGQQVLPSLLAARGYHTMNAGKLHLGPDAAKQFHQVDDRRIDVDSRIWKSMLEGRPKDKPFFLGIGFRDPHRPYEEGVVENPTDPADAIIPPYLADTPETRKELSLYYDYIRRMDKNVGEVLSYLDDNGLAGQTLVIFISDNGMPFPRAKATCYDSGVRVPLIIRLPGQVPANTVSSSLISSVDLAPTMLALSGINPPGWMQGLDMREVLFNPQARLRQYIHAECNWHDIDDHVRAVRDERFKYIRNYFPHEPYPLGLFIVTSPTYKSMKALRDANRLNPEQMRLFMVPRPAEELYDTHTDSYEFSNLVGNMTYEHVLERMRTEADRWIKSTNDVPPEKRHKNLIDRFTGEIIGNLYQPPERR